MSKLFVEFQVLWYSDIFILELLNTPHNCSQHSPATVWLKSKQPDNNISKNIYSVGSPITMSC
jgi:hypothetical protein